MERQAFLRKLGFDCKFFDICYDHSNTLFFVIDRIGKDINSHETKLAFAIDTARTTECQLIISRFTTHWRNTITQNFTD